MRSVRVVTERVYHEGRQAYGGRAVKVLVDRTELLVIVAVRAGVAKIGGVVHAGVLIRPVLARVAEADGVAEFLTHHMLAVRSGVAAAVKVGVVHFRGALRYVDAARDVYGSQPEPAVETVRRVT